MGYVGMGALLLILLIVGITRVRRNKRGQDNP
jgi:hypothetical protein